MTDFSFWIILKVNLKNSEIKSIAIEITDKAFLPESYAYRDFFIQKGFKCEFLYKGDADILNYDAVLLFHGFHPFWRKYPKYIIGEYHSLSTGRYSRLKDLFKRVFNVRPSLYIFLNEKVREKLWFSKNINYATRSMGFNKDDFKEFENKEKIFDIVYCGSYREGLTAELEKLANMGFSIALVGPEILIDHKNITLFGRQEPNKAREIMSQARYGLNYTPDIFPLNIQDSTKVIEYCAAGLGVITNRYQWVNNFERARGGNFLCLDNIKKHEDVDFFNFIIPCVSDLSWSELIENTGIEKRIKLL